MINNKEVEAGLHITVMCWTVDEYWLKVLGGMRVKMNKLIRLSLRYPTNGKPIRLK